MCAKHAKCVLCPKSVEKNDQLEHRFGVYKNFCFASIIKEKIHNENKTKQAPLEKKRYKKQGGQGRFAISYGSNESSWQIVSTR